VKREKRRVTSFGRAAFAARFFHFANVWQIWAYFAKHWQKKDFSKKSGNFWRFRRVR
jgi:hypothetical protein